MVADPRAAALLSGPRGRRLCAAAAEQVEESLVGLFNMAASSPHDAAARSTVLAALRRVDWSAVADLTDPTSLLGPLADTVAFAMYWQEPEDKDLLLDAEDFRAALAPIAQALAEAPATAWWTSGVALDVQHCVSWLTDRTPVSPELGRAADTLRRWKATAAAEERAAADRPADPRARISGSWWSAPLLPKPITTSRAMGPLGAVGLLLIEDSSGWTDAQVWPLTPDPGARIYEITDPAAWTALVEQYPLEVTLSRRHDWWRATGRSGTWHIPDWEQVGAHYDGVHLTVLGYLATAGLGLDIAGSATLLAGWSPDQTFWLADVVRSAGRSIQWHWEDTNDLSSWSPRVDSR